MIIGSVPTFVANNAGRDPPPRVFLKCQIWEPDDMPDAIYGMTEVNHTYPIHSPLLTTSFRAVSGIEHPQKHGFLKNARGGVAPALFATNVGKGFVL